MKMQIAATIDLGMIDGKKRMTDFRFQLITENNEKVEQGRTLYLDGPCKLVYDVNDESPLFAIDMIGRKRVWAETESNIQVIENSVYHSDRLSKMINVDGNNVLTNAAHGRSLLPYVQKKPLKIIENEKITECNELYIDGPSRWVYNPDKRLEVENHKFSVWIETDSSITILS